MLYRFAFTTFILSFVGILVLADIAILTYAPQFDGSLKRYAVIDATLCAVSLATVLMLHFLQKRVGEPLHPVKRPLDALESYMFGVMPVFTAIFGYGALALHVIAVLCRFSFVYEHAAVTLDKISVALLITFGITFAACLGYAVFYLSHKRHASKQVKQSDDQKSSIEAKEPS